MTREQFDDRIFHLHNDACVHSTGDFQCDASDGYPVALHWNTVENVAWIEPMWSLREDQYLEALTYCCEYGLHRCLNYKDFNTILRDLDRDAYTFWSLTEDPYEYEEEKE